MIAKLLSARFWTIMMVTSTYCVIVAGTAFYYVSHVNADKMEGFTMGLVMGFASFATKTLIEYFNKDRQIGVQNEKAQ